MKKLIAVLAGFALPAAAALYVARAPLGGPFDALAASLIAQLGQIGAVAVLLALGVILALPGALLVDRAGSPEPSDDDLDPDEDTQAEPTPFWTPEPGLPDARIAGLRRRALSPGEPAPELAPAPAPSALPPPPVILIRKPRERGRDWFADTSWFGGLPRLGDAPWPRGADGVALPFVAQIDCAELAAQAPGAPLPRTGSLAFFLGTGAVVAVPEGAGDFTDPPADLPPAYDEGGAAFPATPNRLTRWFFPFWPVAPVALYLPEPLRDHRDRFREVAIEEAMAVQLQRHAPLRDHPFYAAGVGAPVEALWWHGVIHLADQLHEALDACARPMAFGRDALDHKRAALADLRADPQASPDAVFDAEQAVDYLAEELEELEAQGAALPDMVAALEQFAAGRDPWAALTPGELDIVAEVLAEVHERFGELVRYHVPGSLAQLATLSLRAMVSGPPDALAALPDDMLARINRDYRLPPVDQHQMFGLAASRGPARDREAGDMLLLQLGYDDMMEWAWGETGVYQFRIDAADAAAGRWEQARLTFESD